MLILVRGLPGSGKSTFAKKQYPDFNHFEADDFWVDREFEPSLLPEAHAQCQENTYNSLVEGHSVIVSNTFTRLWEMKRYFEIATELNELIYVYRMMSEYTSIHSVPEATINKMRTRFEDYPSEIKILKGN